MKKCEKCQLEFTDEVNFCNQCGSPLTTDSPQQVESAEVEVTETPVEPEVIAVEAPEVETAQSETQHKAPQPQPTAAQTDKNAEDVADEFYHKSKETIKNVSNKMNGFIEKPDSEVENTSNQLRNENYGLYYVKIFRVLIIILSVLVFLFSAVSAFQMGYYNPVAALLGLFGAVIGAGLTYFFLNFSLKMFENIARIGRNVLDIRNMMMEEKDKKK